MVQALFGSVHHGHYPQHPPTGQEARCHREDAAHLKGTADDSILAQEPKRREQIIPNASLVP